MTVKSPILENALSAIRVGVADYLSNEPDRIGASVRNLATGLLLLCKEKLAQLSPDGELLIWKRLVPVPDGRGGIALTGEGRQTVDVQEIKERLTRFGVSVDFKRLTDIAAVRNEIEHHYAKRSPDAIRRIFVDGFHFLHDFLPKYLSIDPKTALGKGVWQALTENAEIYAELLGRCHASFVALNWKNAPVRMRYLLIDAGCPACGSKLVMQDDAENNAWNLITLTCQACSHRGDHDSWVSETLASLAASDRFAEATDGADYRVDTCRRCEAAAFWIAEGECQACGHRDKWEPIAHVQRDARGQMLCHNCDGSGWYPPDGNGDQCEMCAGEGWLED